MDTDSTGMRFKSAFGRHITNRIKNIRINMRKKIQPK